MKMKQRLSAALAMLLLTLGMGASNNAAADDWGCQVLLCLADPRGPTTEGACIPPITKLWRELSKGHAFPFCDMGGGASGGNTFASSGYCREDLVYMSGGDNPQPMCNASGAINVLVNGQLFTRVWWGVNGRLSGKSGGTLSENYSGGTGPQYDPTKATESFLQKLRDQQRAGGVSNAGTSDNGGGN